MKRIQELASYVVRLSYEDIPSEVRHELKIRILDALGCAIGALDGEPVRMIRRQIEDFGGRELVTLIGGGRNAPDRAAFYNGALVRYLDFNDSYLAKHETCHPSDNLGSVLAAAEYANLSGGDFLTALAVAYQIQCRLSDEAPVRAKGFDHTTQGSYAAAAGVCKALGLDAVRTAHALAMSGTAYNALRVTRTGELSHWKGLAYPNTAFGATHAAFLAMRGVTGPLEVIEGNKGFMDSIAGHFDIDWSQEGVDRVQRTIIKKYNAEIHSQSALEGSLQLKHEHGINPADIESIDIAIFDVAYNIIGGGEEGDKTTVQTKEQADHSLQFMVAAALLDDRVMPEQYQPERIHRTDVQELLRRINVQPDADFSRRFPGEMPCRIRVRLANGVTFVNEMSDYVGFHTRPLDWAAVVTKLEQLCAAYAHRSLIEEIEAAVADLESIQVKELTGLLAQVRASS